MFNLGCSSQPSLQYHHHITIVVISLLALCHLCYHHHHITVAALALPQSSSPSHHCCFYSITVLVVSLCCCHHCCPSPLLPITIASTTLQALPFILSGDAIFAATPSMPFFAAIVITWLLLSLPCILISTLTLSTLHGSESPQLP